MSLQRQHEKRAAELQKGREITARRALEAAFDPDYKPPEPTHKPPSPEARAYNERQLSAWRLANEPEVDVIPPDFIDSQLDLTSNGNT